MKKLIAWTLTLALLLSFAPRLTLGVSAEGVPAAHSHSAAQHDCECGAVGCTQEGHKKVTYEPWTGTTALPTSGNYYLTGNVELADETGVTADLNLCLNGYTITAASGKQIMTTPKNNALTVTISDCTAHTDAEGKYTAGVLTGGVDKGKGRGGGAIQIRDGGNLKLYDGIITDNTSDTGGGAIRLGTGATFLMVDGEISGNTAINGTTLKSGGAISMITGGSVTILGGTIKNNTGSDGGAIYTQSNTTIKNCTISGNNAGRGGAVYVSGGAVLTMENCTVEDNEMNAAGAGAVYVTGSTATLTGCTITGNRGVTPANSGASAVYSAANSTVKLHDCTITGNTFGGTATAFFGTVYLANATEKLTLSGKTVIDGNQVAVDGTAAEQNVYLRSIPNTPVDIGGLTAGAKVSIRTHGKAVEPTTRYIKCATPPTDWYYGYVVYENNGMAVDYNTTEGFHYVTNDTHDHCVCGASVCSETGHNRVEYLPWNDKTTLPSAGNYYLNTDVLMEAETSISADLNLCLNGHTVTAAKDKRHLSTPKDLAATVVISDCTATTVDGVYTAGKLTGGADKGNGTGGGAIYIRDGGTLKLYDGIITGNTSLTGGGAIAMNNKTTFLMAGGEVSGNQAINGTTLKNGGGLILRNGCTVQITGGTIKNNTGACGGGIYLEANHATIANCTISENTAQTGAAVYLAQGKTATLTDCDISKNETTGAGGAAVYVKTATITLDGCTMTGNKHTSTSNAGASAIYSPSSSTITLKDCTITENTIAGTANSFRGAVYISGGTEKLILIGDVVIKDNLAAVDGTPVERNIYLQRKPATPVDVGELTDGAELSIYSHWGTEATPTMVKADKAPTAWIRGWVLYDNNGMAVDYDPDDNIFFFAINAEHVHCECGAAECSDSTHAQVGYKPWNDATSLPSAGNFYLNTDVQMATEVSISADLNLCLNGHTVTAAKDKRHMSTPNNLAATITISDCTATTTDGVYTAGKLTGGADKGNGTGGGSIYIRTGGTLKLYDGIITGNSSMTGGGAIAMNTGTTFLMAGGEISDNSAFNGTAGKNGGGLLLRKGCTAQILGGTIKNNTSANGGGVSVEGQVLITNAVITDNQATTRGGGVYVSNGTVLSLSGAPTILGNTTNAGTSNLHLQGDSTLQVGNMTNDRQIGISAQTPFRAVSQKLDKDLSDKFFSDSITFTVQFKDSALYLGAADGHNHCLCADMADAACDHTKLAYAPWNNAKSLPASGYYYLTTDVALTAETSVTADLHLCLNGHTVTAAKDLRHMSTPANVNLTITLSDCTATTVDGVYTAGTLTGGVDKGNGQGGGSVYLRTGATLKLYDGILTNSTSITGGGAVRVNKDAYFFMYGGEISNSTAIKDTTKQPGGGVNGVAGSHVTILGGTIQNNDGSNGGGIFSQGELTVSGGVITGNTAANGGGIYTIRGTAILSGGTVTDNRAETGGGLVGKGSAVTLSGMQITGNTASGNGGGARFAQDTVNNAVNPNMITMTAGTISNNKANEAAGVILEGPGSELVMSGGEISNNQAAVTGGGVYAATKTTFIMDGGQIANNTAKHASGIRAFRSVAKLNGGTITGNRSIANGGGIYASYEQSTVYMNGTKITNNTAQKGAGMLIESKATLQMTAGEISGNTVTKDGGGGILISTDCVMTMSGGSITRNNGRIGAGLYAFRATVTLSGGSISYNQATMDGAGIRHIGGKLYLKGTNVVGNVSKEGNGGGMRAAAAGSTVNGVAVSYPAYVYMYGGTFSNNEAVAGGGIAIDNRGSTLEIYGGTMNNNKAQTQGGAIYSSSFTNVKVSGLKATNNESGQSGGAVYHYKSTTSYKDSVFKDNTTATNGGALYFSLYCKTAVENTVFENNDSGARGGAVYVEFETPAAFADCTFTGNQSVYGGGMFASYTVDLTCNNCTFTDNTAQTSGGGLYAFDMGTLTDCVFAGNKATRGGAILTGNDGLMKGSNGWGTGSPENIGVTLDNCELTGNEATEDGGAVYMAQSCTNELKNTTMTGNTAGNKGSAIWCIADLHMQDLIVTGNTGNEAEGGYAVYLAEAGYDGMSYFRGLMQVSGDVLITENEGGDLYLDKLTTLSITPEGLGKNAKIGVTLDSGLLTQRVFGAYDYEGGDLVYLITYGQRSLTDPQYDATMVVKPQTQLQQTEEASSADTWLYVVIGVIGAAAVTAAVWLALKKKKSAAQESK